MNALVVCECSGMTRNALRAKGIDAWSVDLKPAEDNSEFHHQGDCFGFMRSRRWDLIIAHPTCTYLTNAGGRWLYNYGRQEFGRDEKRWELMKLGAEFFTNVRDVAREQSDHVALENPIPHGHARAIIGRYNQITQPWWFGETQIKATCFWLFGLKPLKQTKNVYRETMRLPYSERAKVHYASPGAQRSTERSRTLPGVAEAMTQWAQQIIDGVV